jgi:hypothetical protein
LHILPPEQWMQNLPEENVTWRWFTGLLWFETIRFVSENCYSSQIESAEKYGTPTQSSDPNQDWEGLPHGGLAQLGERLHGMQEVIGSIPLSSTCS